MTRTMKGLFLYKKNFYEICNTRPEFQLAGCYSVSQYSNAKKACLLQNTKADLVLKTLSNMRKAI